jgi:hypothetical protein
MLSIPFAPPTSTGTPIHRSCNPYSLCVCFLGEGSLFVKTGSPFPNGIKVI